MTYGEGVFDATLSLHNLHQQPPPIPTIQLLERSKHPPKLVESTVRLQKLGDEHRTHRRCEMSELARRMVGIGDVEEALEPGGEIAAVEVEVEEGAVDRGEVGEVLLG